MCIDEGSKYEKGGHQRMMAVAAVTYLYITYKGRETDKILNFIREVVGSNRIPPRVKSCRVSSYSSHMSS